ncbi:MAG: hypothetical protein ABIR19_07150 [Ginsengibacter sp.]
MKHSLITLFATCVFVTLCSSQTIDEPKFNALSFELGKTGIIYNLSFDHKLAAKNFGFRFSVGSNLAKYLNAISFGGGGYHLVGSTTHFLELGLDLQYLIVDEASDDQKGFAFVYPDYSSKTLFPSLNLGYRVYGKNTLFRIGFSPALIKSKIFPGGYIGYGFTF